MRLRHATTDQDDISEALATNFVQSSAAANNGSSEANGKEVDDFVNMLGYDNVGTIGYVNPQ